MLSRSGVVRRACWVAVAALSLLVIVVVFAATFLSYSRAMGSVYSRPWFCAVAVLPAVLSAILLLRLRPKGKRWGLFFVHLAVVLVALGGVISWSFAVRGTLTLSEGEGRSSFELEQLWFSASVDNEQRSLCLSSHLPDEDSRCDLDIGFGLGGEKLEIRLRRYVPDPRHIAPKLVKLGDGLDEPAVAIEVDRAGKTARLWLFAEEAGGSSASFGGLAFRFLFVPDSAAYARVIAGLTSASASQASVAFQQPREKLVITMPDRTVYSFDLEPGDRKVGFHGFFAAKAGEFTILRYVPDFVMDQDMRVTSRSSSPNNPAIQLRVRLGRQTSTVWLFAKVRMFHRPPLPEGIMAEYTIEPAGLEERSWAGNSVLIVSAPGKPFAVVAAGSLLGSCDVGGTVDLRVEPAAHLTIDRFFGSARERYEVVEGRPTGRETTQVLKVALTDRAAARTFVEWVPLGKTVRVQTRSGRVSLRLFKPSMPLGYEVFLERFEARNYPASHIPSAYVSHLRVADASRGLVFRKTVEPNRPLSYGGYKLYQYSYDELGQGGYSSTLGVCKDPGTPVFYTGSFLFVAGLLLHFSSRRRRVEGPK